AAEDGARVRRLDLGAIRGLAGRRGGGHGAPWRTSRPRLPGSRGGGAAGDDAATGALDAAGAAGRAWTEWVPDAKAVVVRRRGLVGGAGAALSQAGSLGGREYLVRPDGGRH